MNRHVKIKRKKATAILVKKDAGEPALLVVGASAIAICAGTIITGRKFAKNTPVKLPEGGLEIGCDYGVVVAAVGAPTAEKLTGIPIAPQFIGGFHFAPGGNATSRAGGDAKPAINPRSVWDLNFRPACPDPRGMVLVEGPRGPFWCDIYLLGVNHVADGTTSRHGATIADGNDPPAKPDGGHFGKLDYETAVAVMKHHQKQLLALDEFFAAAYGVAEKTAHDGDPRTTGLDAPRTSKFGLMQATGNMWVWGHDGDPDTPRASIFGGSWIGGGGAGSRYADVGGWPGDSYGSLGARGRSDHLQLD
jgi:hypothetical protein